MKRRNFIQLSAFASAAVGFPLLNSCNAVPGEQVMSQPVFLSRLFDKNTIIEAGKSYLQKAPAENNDETLIQLLGDNGSITKSSSEKKIHQFLDDKIKNDFEAGNTVLVKGWILAVTEARQCALFALVNSKN